MATHLMNEWESLGLEDGKIRYLQMCNADDTNCKVEVPTEDDEKKFDDLEDEKEKALYSASDTDTVGIFDYNEQHFDTPNNRVLRAFTYISMIAKALPAFNSILKANNKEKIVDFLYNYPERLLYQQLIQIDQDFDSICNEIQSYADDLFTRGLIKKKISNEDVFEWLHDGSICHILATLDVFAAFSVDGKTFRLLHDHKYISFTQMLFHLLVIENHGDSDLLFKEIQQAKKNSKSVLETTLVLGIMRKHLLTSRTIPPAKRQQIIDSLFGKSSRKLYSIPMNGLH